ncbi:adenylate/guanylate cyclase domain-containing protein [Synoicihabitans lomoniglobus]|nr:response regulator [Opitutaceae bacterium LMO-M01]
MQPSMSQIGEINYALARWRHRVRIPLNQIIGYAELLIETIDFNVAEDLLSHLHDIRASGAEISGHFQQMWPGWSKQEDLAGFEAFSIDVCHPMEALEWACEQCVEVSPRLGKVPLAKDLTRIAEAVARLRVALQSFDVDDPLKAEEAESELMSFRYDFASLPPIATNNHHDGARLLVVDDDRINREVIGRRLEKMGFEVVKAPSGVEALELLETEAIDLIMLDIMMPEMDGFATLDRIKADERCKHLPVIMLTAIDDAESIARCLSAGAEDYVPKPFDSIVLRARLDASLDRKSLREKEQNYVSRIRIEKGKTEQLLQSILPAAIVTRLKAGERSIVDHVPEATVLFADIVGFTTIAKQLDPESTVTLLNALFSSFDRLVEVHGLEKIKTIGDAYMAVAGVPDPATDHARRAADMALAIQDAVDEFNQLYEVKWSVRIGLHSGPVMAGIIGTGKFSYDLWGDTVNVASRLESHGKANCIHISSEAQALLGPRYETSELGRMELRNRGRVMVHRLLRKRAVNATP